MDKIEAVRYLKEQGKEADLIDGVVMLTTTKSGAAVGKVFVKRLMSPLMLPKSSTRSRSAFPATFSARFEITRANLLSPGLPLFSAISASYQSKLPSSTQP